MPETDLVIVGGGIVGKCLADAYLRRHPDEAVVVLDKHRIGGGASAYSLAFSAPVGRSSLKRQLLATSIPRFSECGQIRRLPAYYIVPESSRTTFESYIVDGLMRLASELEVQQLYREYPELRTAAGDLIYYTSWAFQCPDLGKMIRSEFEQLERAYSLRTQEGVEIVGLREDAGEICLLSKNGRKYPCRKAVFCVGPWSEKMTGALSLSLKDVRTKKVCSYYLSMPPNEVTHSAVFFLKEKFFVTPIDGSQSLGLSFYCDTWNVDPDKSIQVDESDFETVTELLNSRLPGWSARILGSIAFCDAYTVDRDPKMVWTGRGLGYLGGASGSGFELSLGMAERFVEKISS
jgi:glycine/D-amino acid oxidase-like deaminating enzyme